MARRFLCCAKLLFAICSSFWHLLSQFEATDFPLDGFDHLFRSRRQQSNNTDGSIGRRLSNQQTRALQCHSRLEFDRRQGSMLGFFHLQLHISYSRFEFFTFRLYVIAYGDTATYLFDAPLFLNPCCECFSRLLVYMSYGQNIRIFGSIKWTHPSRQRLPEFKLHP
ncbi:hypothetical protein CEJ45_17290 [Herbaspirillum aquaticum]|uniref:Secreted protein n=1 Tax=Herbaspirillum aquaticum TaxID=568783 RepID=A0A225SRN8_9BURK|nr:hypothetical protein CEJ45_17290 [Herbaspirillum aquaticum]